MSSSRKGWKLWWAVGKGEEAKARRLLDEGAEIDYIGPDGTTPLHVACYNGFDPIVSLLLERGANSLINNEDGYSPIDLARSRNNSSTVLLFDHFQRMRKSDPDVEQNDNLAVISRHKETLNISISDLLRVCSENLIVITREHEHPIHAISKDGLNNLMNLSPHLDNVGLLQVAMTTDPRVGNTIKRHLLYGLLLPRGLTVIKEDGKIMAPSPELHMGDTNLPVGSVTFLEVFGRDVSIVPPDLSSFCHLKGKSNLPVHQFLQFLLHQLNCLDSKESLLGDGYFRLKSYSSVINKLFFRGKKLKDLFATQVMTYSALEKLKALLSAKGAIPLDEDNQLSGNGDFIFRYVRILLIELDGRSPFTVPIYYEIAYHSFETPVPHETYEYERLRYSLTRGDENLLVRMGFTVENINHEG